MRLRLNTYYVYVLFRETGVPFYVGKGRFDRWNDHEKSARRGVWGYKQSVIRKILAVRDDIPKVKIAEDLFSDEASIIEMALIAAIGRYPNGPLVNLTDGGDGAPGAKRSEETRAKLSAKLIGNKRWLGKKHKPETIEKMRVSARAWKRSPCSEERRAKVSAALKGRPKAPETRRKMATANRRRALEHNERKLAAAAEASYAT